MLAEGWGLLLYLQPKQQTTISVSNTALLVFFTIPSILPWLLALLWTSCHPEYFHHQRWPQSRVKLPLLQTTPVALLFRYPWSSRFQICILSVVLCSRRADLFMHLEILFLAVSGAVAYCLALRARLQWLLGICFRSATACAFICGLWNDWWSFYLRFWEIVRSGGWGLEGKAAPVPDEDSPGPWSSEGPPFASLWSTFGLWLAGSAIFHFDGFLLWWWGRKSGSWDPSNFSRRCDQARGHVIMAHSSS